MKCTIKEDLKDEDKDKSVNSRFVSPKSFRDVKAIRKSAVPKKPGKIQIGQREHGAVGLHIA